VIDVVGISFKDRGRVYYFSPNNHQLKKNITVIVETERGLQFGKIETDVIQISTKKITSPLKNVIRIANKQDFYNHKNNVKEAEFALSECKKLVKKFNLDMKIIDANFTFDRKQLLFHFSADDRVDFRELAKALANIYKTRIELRQIGVRDKAKEVGGVGQCGRELCCTKFLQDFDAVSINMAKNQNLSLNPTKINGCCGRLLCCLKYEDCQYSECKKGLPEVGKKVKTDKGEGKVISVDVYKRIYKVEVPNVGIVELTK